MCIYADTQHPLSNKESFYGLQADKKSLSCLYFDIFLIFKKEGFNFKAVPLVQQYITDQCTYNTNTQ